MALGELLPGFLPESDLERALASDPDLLEGLAWGRPRSGHPEGSVGNHVAELLERIERWGIGGSRRADLRVLALVHDAFKGSVHRGLPKSGENHHAMRARRFAERYISDERLLGVIELHDRPYGLWRRLQRTGRRDDHAFDTMLAGIADPELFLLFVELDSSTPGKRPEPVVWFREEMRRRRPGVVAAAEAARRRAASS